MISVIQRSKSSLEGFRTLRQRRAINCCLTTIAVICLCALAGLCATVVRQYWLTRVYDAASCLLDNITLSEQDGHCEYCAGTVDRAADRTTFGSCSPSLFPCLVVTVEFRASAARRRPVKLFTDVTQAAWEQGRCSFAVCQRTREENSEYVEQFSTKMAAHGNISFHCFYDTETLDNVILIKHYSKWDVFHCLFWPTLVLLLCALIFFHIEIHLRGLRMCPSKTSQTEPQELRSTADRHGTEVDANMHAHAHRKTSGYEPEVKDGHPNTHAHRKASGHSPEIENDGGKTHAHAHRNTSGHGSEVRNKDGIAHAHQEASGHREIMNTPEV